MLLVTACYRFYNSWFPKAIPNVIQEQFQQNSCGYWVMTVGHDATTYNIFQKLWLNCLYDCSAKIPVHLCYWQKEASFNNNISCVKRLIKLLQKQCKVAYQQSFNLGGYLKFA